MTSWPGFIGPAFASSDADMPAFSSAITVSKSNWALLRRSPRSPAIGLEVLRVVAVLALPVHPAAHAVQRGADDGGVLGGGEAAERGHPVEPFAAEGEGALAVLLVLVGLGAVGVEVGPPRVGMDPEQLGPDLAGDLGERRLGDRQLLAIRPRRTDCRVSTMIRADSSPTSPACTAAASSGYRPGSSSPARVSRGCSAIPIPMRRFASRRPTRATSASGPRRPSARD